MGTTNFSGLRQYRLTVEASLVSQNSANKTSVVSWEMAVSRTDSYWAWATAGMGNRGRVWDGTGPTLWENGNMAYDFRNGNRWVIASGRRTIQHRSDGTGEYCISGDMNLYNIGSAFAETGWRSLPRLANVPDAPTPLSLDAITTSSMRYRFSGNGNGGATMREWQVSWAAEGTPQTRIWSNGTTTLTGLKPGTLYHWYARGRNDVGWGPWTPLMTARTLYGARVLHAGVWRNAIPYVKHNNVWKPAESHIHHGGKWKRGI